MFIIFLKNYTWNVNVASKEKKTMEAGWWWVVVVVYLLCLEALYCPEKLSVQMCIFPRFVSTQWTKWLGENVQNGFRDNGHNGVERIVSKIMKLNVD